MSRPIAFITLLVLVARTPAQQPPDPTLLATLKAAHDRFHHTMKDFSFLYLHTQFEGDLLTAHSLTEHIRDKHNSLTFNRLPYSRGSWDITRQQDAITEGATISRIRGEHLQVIHLQRFGRFKPWIIGGENYYPRADADRHRGDRPDAMPLGQPTYTPILCTGSRSISLTTLFQHPSFKITKWTEERGGPDRLVHFDFVLDPLPQPTPPDPHDQLPMPSWKDYLPFHHGRITLRPDHDWTLASSTIHFAEGQGGFRDSQSTTTIDYYTDADQKIFPKTIKTVSLSLDKQNKKTEQTSRGNFEFKLYDQLPPETFSLTQFALPEPEPTPPEPAPATTKPQEKRSYLGPSNILPPYAWFTLGALATLVVVFTPRLFRRKKKPAGSWVQA